jgi:hypothetical protein
MLASFYQFTQHNQILIFSGSQHGDSNLHFLFINRLMYFVNGNALKRAFNSWNICWRNQFQHGTYFPKLSRVPSSMNTILFIYLCIHKTHFLCSWLCWSLHVIYCCKDVFNMTQIDECYSVTTDLIQPHTKNKTEKAKFKIQNYYENSYYQF